MLVVRGAIETIKVIFTVGEFKISFKKTLKIIKKKLNKNSHLNVCICKVRSRLSRYLKY